MNKEEKIYLVVNTFLNNSKLSISELSLLPELKGISKSSISRYLNDPIVANLFGEATYEQIKDILTMKRIEGRKKGGLTSFQNNQSLKDENGKFVGSTKAINTNNIQRKIKHILIFTQMLLENQNFSLQDIADLYNETNADGEHITRDYVYDCLSEHEKYNIFSEEISQKISEILVQRRILGNKKGALKTNENRGR